MSYKHLSLEERHYIEISLRMDTPIKEIAEALGRCESTMSREISRNKGKRGYRHQQADRLAMERHRSKNKVFKMTDEIKRQIKSLIAQASLTEWISTNAQR